MKLSFVLPCWQRPQRTRRIIQCIANQGFDEWEGFIIGDGCGHFEQLLADPWYTDIVNAIRERGNVIHTYNMEKNYGGHGYHIINEAIANARGKYFIWLNNDDIIQPNHFAHYHNEMEYLQGILGVELDFIFFNTDIPARNGTRISSMSYGGCGHAELLVRTSFLKTMPPSEPKYGHDWVLIQNMMNATSRFKKAQSQNTTYSIMSIPGYTVDTID